MKKKRYFDLGIFPAIILFIYVGNFVYKEIMGVSYEFNIFNMLFVFFLFALTMFLSGMTWGLK